MKQVALATLLLLGISVPAWADSPHYKRGPSCVDNGFTATCTGSLSGLGNGNVIVTADFPNAVGTTTCTNKGGTTAPGQNPATPAATSGTQFIPKVKNGNVAFSVTTDEPDAPAWNVAGCANPNWTAAFSGITFGTGTLTVEQETFQGSGVYEVVLVTTITL